MYFITFPSKHLGSLFSFKIGAVSPSNPGNEWIIYLWIVNDCVYIQPLRDYHFISIFFDLFVKKKIEPLTTGPRECLAEQY